MVLPLITLIIDLNVSAIERYIKKGLDVNILDRYHDSPLHCIFYEWEIVEHRPAIRQIFKMLIQAGADPNAKNEYNSVPLISAITYAEPVQMLLDAGADPTIQNKFGTSPLSSAIYQRKFDIVKMLVAAGARLETVSIRKVYTSTLHNDKITKWLLANGIQLDLDFILEHYFTFKDEIIDNIIKKQQWKVIPYLPPCSHQYFPAPIVKAALKHLI